MTVVGFHLLSQRATYNTLLLPTGVLVEEYVLDHIPKLMTFLRECNTTLRWLMLHTTTPPNHKRCKQLYDTVMAHNVGSNTAPRVQAHYTLTPTVTPTRVLALTPSALPTDPAKRSSSSPSQHSPARARSQGHVQGSPGQ